MAFVINLGYAPSMVVGLVRESEEANIDVAI